MTSLTCVIDGDTANPVPGATLTLAAGDDAVCTFVNDDLPPAVSFNKTVVGEVQQADGSWKVQYLLTVFNPSRHSSQVYTLNDSLKFGGGIVVKSATVEGKRGAHDPDDQPDMERHQYCRAADRPEDHSVQGHRPYLVTVTATVPGKTTVTARDCTVQTGEKGTGFLNSAMLTSLSATKTATACATPVSPTLTKTVASVTAGPTSGTFVVAYDVTVANPSPKVGLVYSLGDAPAFPGGVTISEPKASVVRSNLDGSAAGSSVVISSWASNGVLVKQQALPGGKKDTYRVSVLATVPSDLPASVLACSGSTPQHGFFNVGIAASGGDILVAHACAPIVVPVPPTVPTTTDHTGHDHHHHAGTPEHRRECGRHVTACADPAGRRRTAPGTWSQAAAGHPLI